MALTENGEPSCSACAQFADFGNECLAYRKELLVLADGIGRLMQHPTFETGYNKRIGQQKEIKANIMLAYRHLKDARMRLGKALQAASEDGVSIYDN